MAYNHFFNENVTSVKAEIAAYGFTNVVTIPIKDLRTGWLTKDGAVESVSINGKTDFKKKAKFPPDAAVVIKYHTFRDRFNSDRIKSVLAQY